MKFGADMDRERTHEMLTYKSPVTERCKILKVSVPYAYVIECLLNYID
jgi:hypothetical protein